MKKSNQTIIFIKNSQTNKLESNRQTLKLRKNANSKIRLLGNKFYEIKNLIDRLNIHRDSLYWAGKEIEERFKNIKKITPLQNQCKRLKDSLLVWFAENFYNELTHQNQLIYEILKSRQGFEFLSKLKLKANAIQNVQNKIKNRPNVKKQDDSVIGNNLIVNTEIDEYGVKQIDEHSLNNNFDFNKYFEFYLSIFVIKICAYFYNQNIY